MKLMEWQEEALRRIYWDNPEIAEKIINWVEENL